MIRAFGIVKTTRSSVVPMMGRVRVTDALTVRGAAVGVAMTVVVGVAVTVATEVGAV